MSVEQGEHVEVGGRRERTAVDIDEATALKKIHTYRYIFYEMIFISNCFGLLLSLSVLLKRRGTTYSEYCMTEMHGTLFGIL